MTKCTELKYSLSMTKIMMLDACIVTQLKWLPCEWGSCSFLFVLFFSKKSLRFFLSAMNKMFSISFFSSHKKHLSILSPSDSNIVNMEMHMKMAEADFQNIMYPCCGLVEIQKWSIEHNRCYGSDVEQWIIEASAQNCPTCGQYCGGSIQLVWHMEWDHGAAMMFVCTLCRNPYVMKVVLDCHIALNHGGVDGVRHDYERKYKPSMH